MTASGEAELQAAIAARPGDAAAWASLARLYGATGLLDKAIGAFDRAVRLDPQAHAVRLDQGRTLHRAGRLQEASILLVALATERPAYIEALEALADLHDAMGEPAKALARYRTVLMRRPDMAGIRHKIARLHGRAGQLDLQAAVCDEILAVDPDDLFALDALSAFHIAAGRWSAAIPYLTRLDQLGPPDATALLNLSKCWEATDLDEAIRLSRLAAERYPDDPRCWTCVAIQLSYTERLVERRVALQQVLEQAHRLAPRSRGDGTDLPFEQPDGAPPALIADALGQRGAVLLRGLIPPALLSPLLARAQAMLPEAGSRDFAPLAELTGAEILSSGLCPPILLESLATFFGHAPEFTMMLSFLRRVLPDRALSQLPFHQDISGLDRFGVNCWIPLHTAGGSAPGLELVARRTDEVYPVHRHLEADGTFALDPAIVRDRFDANDIQAPRFEPGDLLLFTASTIHRTLVRPGMTDSRLSIEARFV